MIKQLLWKTALAVFSILIISSSINAQSPVEINGKLKLVGNQLSSECGKPVQLRGMSTHGPQWFPQCYQGDYLDVMINDWNIDIFRIAMYTDAAKDGYLKDPSYWRSWIDGVVDLCEQKGIYCLIDWHILSDNDPHINKDAAIEFWDYMSRKHAGKDHVIYEICNEPNGDGVDWPRIKDYAEEVIPVIRANDPETIIVVGTPSWSGNPWDVVGNELSGDNAYNTMYTFHFYAGSHSFKKAPLRTTLGQIPIFATEWGTSDASGNANFSPEETLRFMEIFDGDNDGGQIVSWCNWSFADKAETSAALSPGACNARDWNNTSQSGTLIKQILSTQPNPYQGCSPEPVIFSDPSDVVVSEGETATFRISAGGDNIQYQWKKNGVDIPNTNSDTYIIQNALSSDVAEYSVTISNSYGSLTSNTANLVILADGPFFGEPIKVPALIEAENYDVGANGTAYSDNSPGNEGASYREDDVDIEAKATGYSIGYTAADEYLNYAIEVVADGEYDFTFNTGGASDGKSFRIEIDGQDITGSVSVPNTGSWTDFQEVTISNISLTKGIKEMRLIAETDGFNIDYINITGDIIVEEDCNGVEGGSASIDDCNVCSGGDTGIEPNSSCTDCNGDINGNAEIDDCNVCAGGNTGITPNESCTDCNGDINGNAELDDCDVCAGGNTGIAPNESCTDCNGDVNGNAELDECGVCAGGNTGVVPGSGCEAPAITTQPIGATLEGGDNSTLSVVASSNAALSYQWYKNGRAMDGETTSTLSINNAAASDAGTYYVVVTDQNGSVTSDFVDVLVQIQSPYLGSAHIIPGIIEAEDFDAGGAGLAYEDDNANNEGNAYRNEGVDIEETGDVEDNGGYNVGWTIQGEWLEYTVDIQENGYYDFDFRVASETGFGVFSIAIDGNEVISDVAVDATGGWQEYITINTNEVQLSAGEAILRLNVVESDFNINKMVITKSGNVDCNGDINGTATLDDCGVCSGGNTGVLPNQDSDNDGVLDCEDICDGDDNEDMDNDGTPDSCDDDIDGDGIDNQYDCDPLDKTIYNTTKWYADTDGDGYGDANDYIDACLQPDGYVKNADDLCATDGNKMEPGDCGCGVEEGTCTDCNGDVNGTAEYDACDVCAGGNTGVIPTTDPDLCAPVLSTNDDLYGNGLAVYPNPTEGNVVIENLEGQNWVIYSSTGVLVQEGNESNVDLSNQDAGIYLLQIEDAVFKVIKK